MIDFKKILFLTVLIVFLSQTPLLARYDPHARLLIENSNFCVSKPRGLGRFEAVGGEGFEAGDDVYLYAEAKNCKAKRSGEYFNLYLIMDIDIFYENGMCVYSQKDVKSFNPKSHRELSKAMLWVKIETRFLKPGEYKVEVKLRDENSGKEGFVIKKFKIR